MRYQVFDSLTKASLTYYTIRFYMIQTASFLIESLLWLLHTTLSLVVLQRLKFSIAMSKILFFKIRHKHEICKSLCKYKQYTQ